MDSEGNIGPVIVMGRKRPREFETDTQRVKREKAAERQRRKRERDRAQAQADAASQAQPVSPVAMIAFPTPEQFHHHFAAHLQQTLSQVPAPLLATVTCGEYVPPPPVLLSPPPAPSTPLPPAAPESPQPPMTQEEVDRRDKLRAAARERQRKHRSAVKQRKMRELGLDVDVVQQATMDELQYRSELGSAHLAPHMFDEFAAVQALGGQTFASTLLLSFSCAPLLKAHLLRTLSMTNEELASLEPVIAEAWDRWNAQRQVHYAEAAKNGVPPPVPGHHPGFSVDLTGHHGVGMHMHPPPHLSPHSQLHYLHFQPPHQPPPQPIVKHNQPPTSPQPPPPPSSEEQETPPQEPSPQTPQTPQPQEQQESPPQDPPPSPQPPDPEQQQSPSPQQQPQSLLPPQASPSPTPQPGHPPPPTFAAPNGPCLTPQLPPPPTTAAVNDALDFRSRFWLSFNAKRILGSSGLLGASARASTFRDPYGDSAASGLGKGGVREMYASSAATRARARRDSGDSPGSTGSTAASSSGTSSSMTSSSSGGSGDTPDAVEDMNIDPHLEDEDEEKV